MAAKTTISQLPAMATYGRYAIIGRLAVGGMAEVFLAREPPRVRGAKPRLVVVKRMMPSFAEDPAYRAMFLDEARLLFRIQHPGIVHVYDFGEEGGRPYLAMEWVHGTSLHSALRKAKGGVDPATAVKVAAHVASALQHVHTLTDDLGEPLGVVHRDVTPHNIMLGWDGAVKLLDFGVAKGEGRETQTRDGQVKGKLSYLAPEQVRGLEMDGRTDVFALGICLFESLTGRPLFRRKSEYLTFKAVADAEVPTLRQVKPDADAGLEALLAKALQREASDRYQSAEELQIALEQWLIDQREIVPQGRIAEFLHSKFGEFAGAMPTLDLSASHAPTSALSLADLQSIESAGSIELVTSTQIASEEILRERIDASTPAPATEESERIGHELLARLRAERVSGPVPAGTGAALAVELEGAELPLPPDSGDESAEPGPATTLQGYAVPEAARSASPPSSAASSPPSSAASSAASSPPSSAAPSPASSPASSPDVFASEPALLADAEEQRSRRGALWIALALLLLSVVIGMVILLPGDTSGPVAIAPPPRAAIESSRHEIAPPPADAPAAPSEEAPDQETGEYALPEGEPAATATESSSALAPAPTMRRRRRSAMAREGSAAPNAPASAASMSMEEAVAGTGRLAINTRPWSQVYFRGRLLGTTPLGSVELPAGMHALQLVDRDGESHRRTVTIRANETTREFFPLTAE